MSETATLERISQVVSRGSRFLIVSHCEPEGDGLGSSLALKLGLEAIGKQACAYNKDGVPRAYDFLPGAEQVSCQLPDGDWDAAFVLDSSCLERIGPLARELAGRASLLINIDHHAGNQRYGDVNLIDARASSTGELVHRVLMGCNLPITDEILQLLLCAIYTDTGSLRYANTTAGALEIVTEAVRRGVQPWQVAQALYERNSLGRIHALGRALNSVELGPSGSWCVMTVSRAALMEAGAATMDTEGFINYARSVEGVEVAILLREDGPELYKVSLRSKGWLDVSRIARDLGGGGHHFAAAASVVGGLQNTRARVIDLVERALSEEMR